MRTTTKMPVAKKTPAAPSRDRRQKVTGAEMGMEVLKALAAMDGSATLTALSNELGESPAKMHRYLASLVASGMVAQDASAGRYVLGPETINIGLTAMRRLDLVSETEQVMRTLAQTLRISCCLGILGNVGPVIVRWEEPPSQPVTVNVRIGSVLPVLWSSTGRAFAAFTQSQTLDDIVQRELKEASPGQRKALPNLKAVEAMLDQIRAQGCASVEGVLLPGINAISVPVFDVTRRLAGVLTALGVSASFDSNPEAELGTLLKRSAAELSARLGYRP